MNILLEFSLLNYRTYHSMACRLKEIFPNSRFAGIVGYTPEGDQSIKFLKEQKDIHYEFLIARHEITQAAFSDPIDHDFLKTFEAGLQDMSFWRMISADRILGAAYAHGSCSKRLALMEEMNRDRILGYFGGAFKRLKKIFDDFSTDLFLPAMCMGTVDVFILEEICRLKKIPYITLNTARVKDLAVFGADVISSFPHINKAYTELIEGKRTINLKAAEDLYTELTRPDKYLMNTDLRHPVHQRVKTQGVSHMTLIVSMTRAFVGAIRDWIKQRSFNMSNDPRRQPYRLDVLADNIRLAVTRRFQDYEILNSGFGQYPVPGEKFIYYPLHVNPEYSTNFQGTMWMNQLYTIELLSKSVPYDWYVYVKEHPGMIISRMRPNDFYRNIKKFPNVRMIAMNVTGQELIEKSQMVAVVTGTSGWEAILRGKPVVSLVDNFFDVLGLSRKYSTIETLSKDIRDEVNRIANLNPIDRKKRLVCYLAAILENSFDPTYPPQLFNEPGSIHEYEVDGRELAEAVVKYLKTIGYLPALQEGVLTSNQ